MGLPVPDIQHKNPRGVSDGRLLTYFVEKLDDIPAILG
jgi:hypothetical protein